MGLVAISTEVLARSRQLKVGKEARKNCVQMRRRTLLITGSR